MPFETEQDYAGIIGQYIPYFNLLDDGQKKRFINRTWHFRNAKNFHFTGITEQKEMSILISAAAVQLTFGLSKYKLSYFKDIYVLPDAYEMDSSRLLVIGHVSKKGIHISWKYFLQGYADSSDSVNVAIHEMAHALEYNSFIDHLDTCPEFINDFVKFPRVFGPSLAHVIVQKRSYLRTYAYTNLQEFWAVSVEAFFENPSALKENMPDLYRSISEILNQDLTDGVRITTLL